MTHHILQIGSLPPWLESQLPEIGAVDVLSHHVDPAAFLAEHGSKFTVVVTNATVGVDAARMQTLPQLQAICSLGVGFDAIDLVAARERGIVVSNTPDVLNDCVADLTIGLLIDAARGITAGDRHVRSGRWQATGPAALGTRFSGRRLGLLGMGGVAQAIAHRATGFSMDIRYHCRTPRPHLPWQHESNLLELAQWADFLVIACAGGTETQHLVSASVLHALGPQGFLVNVARGSVVDEAALVRALLNGELGGAALDVFEDEPRVPEALFAMENVVLTPHVGSATGQTRRAMAELVLENLKGYMEQGRLVTEVRA